MTNYKSTPIPAEKADTWDLEVKTLAGRLGDRRKELHKGMGKRPFKGTPVTTEQQMISMGSLKVQDWGEIIQKHARFKEDGRILLPKTMITQAKKLHKLGTQGEINL